MCIGVPMRVLSTQPGYALCEGMGETRLVDILLVGEQPIGSWLLVFLDTAREVLSEEGAREITQALQALDLAIGGERDIDHLFSDLVNREPQLPPHLRPAK
ncbi:MAG: HypC/HybG/HupF family hydrogenase formation chaperone [gamma proteobacterium symbiont of Ctena orbiculata]|nr:HypC/HybG/HupF family hydrogenase formation chaperone [Candidatus Thiodiazotropha taylori]MBT3059821.1 HypC/HybG/HupF family hydrogenase formation chaperone [Candidatus Thiodiazotropha sp. (ex Lucina pensylvanica)]MBV2094534.1 HypC/HybG/HupF family hydrogenase formation chaperone [Candidatus Thiodiazotropha sp. (ex Codakia orbicularis)]PUB73750.1 MAG: HypC/HybG/HupF family hydrogenase formation chaperone [gamma proteobacterium symbiont of Ctena orbiculata]MBT3061344.1 HypC/HybG/HupF family h